MNSLKNPMKALDENKDVFCILLYCKVPFNYTKYFWNLKNCI
jgi:hypothetical protein